ncbi:LysM peptidoglycan-binding domain-containing protein [Chryseobacterium sp. ES2]|uniref:LysM peptidoglycan-binding domain-containing protein n=1 Tax=Chryseobacterium metallicongregator TaxID=3073042 RepID=A0ABU1E7I4_9FLAO|nr:MULTISPECIES: LysM peptidoglycan-binding domain-containing protein [Chryseobacterium]MDR4953706.1 LysM peptidoglycan-binding domain-containing protein [Chryseobacterium sp. ES2]
MEIDFLQYQVRNGDTLTSIASRLGMTSEELKLFHNSHCQKMDTVWFESLNEVKNIFVPTNFKTKEQKEQERKNTFPSLWSDSFFAKRYTVNETFESPYESSVNISYTIELNLRKDKNTGRYILSYLQSDFKSDGNTPDDKVSSISIVCMQSIMPLEFVINEQGKITGFADHKKMTDTFFEQRKELEEFYVGEIFQNYMNTFERNINDEMFLLKQFQSTLLFQTLFPKIEWFQKKASWKESFYLIQNSFPVQCELNIEQSNDDENSALTILNGKITERCTSQEIIRGIKFKDSVAEAASGTTILEYTTHTKNKTLLQAKASVVLSHEEGLIHQHHINITQG